MRRDKYYCKCGASFSEAKYLRMHRNDCNNSMDTMDVDDIHQEVSVSEWFAMKTQPREE